MSDSKIPKPPPQFNPISYRIANILNIIKQERADIIKFNDFKDKFARDRVAASRREYLKNKELEEKSKKQ